VSLVLRLGADQTLQWLGTDAGAVSSGSSGAIHHREWAEVVQGETGLFKARAALLAESEPPSG
jgi:hypothetical protein